MSTLEVSNLNDGTTTVATTYITNGSAKAWVKKDSAGTAIEDSFNVSSITDTGTGDANYNFTNNMANAYYSFATGAAADGLRYFTSPTAKITTSYLNVKSYNNSGTIFDIASGTIINGDLA